MRKLNKRGSDLALPIVLFLVLNIAFFVMMMLFVQRVSSSALVYEEVYAKKIGLLLDRAEPGMSFEINISDLIGIARKNGLTNEEMSRFLVTIDTEKSIIEIKARKEGGFRYPYFSKVKLSGSTRLSFDDIKNKDSGGIYHLSLE